MVRFDLTSFKDWLSNTALPNLKSLNGIKLMIGNNLVSNLTINVIEQCEENNIKLDCSHLIHPIYSSFWM